MTTTQPNADITRLRAINAEMDVHRAAISALSDERARLIRQLQAQGLTYRAIGRHLRISVAAVSKVALRAPALAREPAQ